MDNPIKELAIEILKFVGTSATVATICFLWIRQMQGRIEKVLSRLQEKEKQLKQCRQKRHEEKDEMIEEMERDVAMMEKIHQQRES